MSAFEALLLILFLMVMISAVAEHLKLAYPLMLVLFGLGLGFIPGIPHWFPPRGTVLTIFLPPIIYQAAYFTSWRDFKANIVPISSLAIFLVIFTAFSIAGIMNYLIPEMGFATALILGAIVSPPDAVAATSILSRLKIPPRIISILENESLVNDASCIVLYKIAMSAMLAPVTYTLGYALVQFCFIAVGGVAIGLAIGFATGLVMGYFLHDRNSALPITMRAIIPFVTYIIAEQLGVSGVLAVVAAGLIGRKIYGKRLSARTRLVARFVSDTTIFLLNGLIFILIGLQFPHMLISIRYMPLWTLLFLSIVVIIVTIGTRLLWVFLTSHLLAKIRYLFTKNKNAFSYPSWKNMLVVSWAGMRGIVSLALALALPVSINDGILFPYRSLIIFLTFVVILFTLEVQGLTLPWLIRFLKIDKEYKKQDTHSLSLLMEITQKALHKIKDIHSIAPECNAEVKEILKNLYSQRIIHLQAQIKQREQKNETVFNQTLKNIIAYERKILSEMWDKKEVTQELKIELLRQLDMEEVRYTYIE